MINKNVRASFASPIKVIATVLLAALSLTACVPNFDFLKSEPIINIDQQSDMQGGSLFMIETKKPKDDVAQDIDQETTATEETIDPDEIFIDTTTKLFAKHIKLDMDAPYATYSVINKGQATLYKPNVHYIDINKSTKSEIISIKKRIGYTPVVTINAGHGTSGGTKVKTFSHPDFTPKYAGGTTSEGEVMSAAVSTGMNFDNGMKEADANLLVACRLKDMLLDEGYKVLMIRESDDVQLDNVARTVIANENSDIHIAIHFDSTDSDKGIFYITPIENKNYLSMEPLKSNYDGIVKLGDSIINACRKMGLKIFKEKGKMVGDLTQLSYSTIPSVDIELGDKKTKIDVDTIETFAYGIKRGIDDYFEDE